MHNWIRWTAFGFGGLMILGGLVAASAGEPGAAAEAVIIGAVLMVAAILQRPRYRSAAAEHLNAAAGPGGGEDGPLEPRFLATLEVFVDPTTGRLMRVFVDPRTGERRYRAEG